MRYFVYILRTSANTLYIGQTNNLVKRIQEHKSKSGKSAKYIRYFSSFELVYQESHSTRSSAMKREARLKKWPRDKKLNLIRQISLSKVYVEKSDIPFAGRGVFAKVEIAKGEIIERCPIIEISQNDISFTRSHLATYFFYFGKQKERAALALGFGSIYNHSKKPNAKFKIKPADMIIEFVALKNVKIGAEITFDYYGSDKVRKNPLWFEEK